MSVYRRVTAQGSHGVGNDEHIMQELQHTQRTITHKRTKSDEKVNVESTDN